MVSEGEDVDDEEQEYTDIGYTTTDKTLESGKQSYTCNLCSVSFTVKQSLIKHSKDAHDVENKQGDVSGSKYNCDQCRCSYTKESSLKKHQIQKHSMSFMEEKEFSKCKDCDQVFHTNFHLMLHQYDKHDAKEQETDEIRRFTNYRKFLLHQIRMHSDKNIIGNEKYHVCKICKKTFARSDALTDHWNSVHSGKRQKSLEKRAVCEVCGLAFSKNCYLREHVALKHLDVPLKNKCEYCSKSFNRTHLLEFHVNKEHLGKKPFICDKCGKGCYSSRARREHMKICQMSEEKMITCEHCHKTFTSKQNCTYHIQAIHSEPALACPCGVVVKWMSSMAKHKRRCKLNTSSLRDKSSLGSPSPATLLTEKEEGSSKIRVAMQDSEKNGNGVEYIEEMDSEKVCIVQDVHDSSWAEITPSLPILEPAVVNVSIDPNTTGVIDKEGENVVSEEVVHEHVLSNHDHATDKTDQTSMDVYCVVYK